MGFCLSCLQPRARDWNWRIFIHNFLYFNSTCQIVCQSVWQKKMGEIKASLILKEHRCVECYKFSGDYSTKMMDTCRSGVRNCVGFFLPFIINSDIMLITNWHTAHTAFTSSMKCNHLLELNVKIIPNTSLTEIPSQLSAQIHPALSSHLQQISN